MMVVDGGDLGVQVFQVQGFSFRDERLFTEVDFFVLRLRIGEISHCGFNACKVQPQP